MKEIIFSYNKETEDKAKLLDIVDETYIKYLYYHPSRPQYLVIICENKNVKKIVKQLDIETHAVATINKK